MKVGKSYITNSLSKCKGLRASNACSVSHIVHACTSRTDALYFSRVFHGPHTLYLHSIRKIVSASLYLTGNPLLVYHFLITLASQPFTTAWHPTLKYTTSFHPKFTMCMLSTPSFMYVGLHPYHLVHVPRVYINCLGGQNFSIGPPLIFGQETD